MKRMNATDGVEAEVTVHLFSTKFLIDEGVHEPWDKGDKQ